MKLLANFTVFFHNYSIFSFIIIVIKYCYYNTIIIIITLIEVISNTATIHVKLRYKVKNEGRFTEYQKKDFRDVR